MGYVLVFSVVFILGLAIGSDLGVLAEQRRNDRENAEVDRQHAKERAALRRERDDYRENPRVPAEGWGGYAQVGRNVGSDSGAAS